MTVAAATVSIRRGTRRQSEASSPSLPQFPCTRSHSMSTLRSHCRCSSSSSTPNSIPAAQPPLLGGSTAEIVRILGGPAVGDTQSRCLRLAGKTPCEAVAVRQSLGHRLPLDARQAKSEWCYCGGVLSKSMTLWKESTPSGQE